MYVYLPRLSERGTNSIQLFIYPSSESPEPVPGTVGQRKGLKQVFGLWEEEYTHTHGQNMETSHKKVCTAQGPAEQATYLRFCYKRGLLS